ncbi:MAG TPA: metallophosphoesterase [Actinomycetota bacterium]|nr:metallophosphoesterase [Actinomycetota bacterium]
MTHDLAADTIADLLRSGWIVHEARRTVYEGWSEHDPRFAASGTRAAAAAAVFGEELDRRGARRPAADIALRHAAWIRRVAGDLPDEVPLGYLLVLRLGDWAEAHATLFVEDAARLTELGDEERAATPLPDSLPPPAGFRPLEMPPAPPPGDVRFRFGILGDLHFGSPLGEAMARGAIADLNAAGVDLVIQLGDITDHGDPAEFELAGKVLAELEMPCTTMLGNHDVFSHREERLAGRELYRNSFGREADGVLIEHRGMRFAVLDSAESAASPFAPFDLVSGRFTQGTGGATVRGALTPPQHEILAEVAAPGAPPAFVFLHHPVQPFTGFPPVVFGLRDADSGRLHAVCDSGNVWGVFSGHTHRNARTRSFDGVPAHEVAIPRDYPFGFAIVDVTDVGYAFRFVHLSDRELLEAASRRTTLVHQRYGAGAPEERAFVWTR